jgi:hypothetical protein
VSGRDGLQGLFGSHLLGRGAEVAAAFGPFVVLLGQDGADEADDRVPVGKMPTTSVRARISLLSRSLGLFDQICRQISWGNAVKARMSWRALLRGRPRAPMVPVVVSRDALRRPRVS